MLERDPHIILRNLVSNEWNTANTSLASAPRCHTGWYDYGSSDPQVTFTNADEGTLNGGDTGATGVTSSGGVAKVRGGILLVNAWAGTRSDMNNAGQGGDSVNPKTAAYEMGREVARILDQSGGTTNPDTGEPELASLVAGDGRPVVDTDADAAVFRWETTARYTYAENTEFV